VDEIERAVDRAARPAERWLKRDAAERLAKWDPEQLDGRMLAVQVGLQQFAQQLASTTRELRRTVIWSGSVVIPASGVVEVSGGESYAMWVSSPAAVTVVAGPATGSEPSYGVGVFAVAASVPVTLNAHTDQWSVWGTSGTVVCCTVFGEPQAFR